MSYHADIVTQAIVNGGEAIPFASLEYERIASLIVARHVRRVREALEKTAMAKAGHPVPLPVGLCGAILTVGPQGNIERFKISQCASRDLEQAERQAIAASSPLPPPGEEMNVIVNTNAPIATPGVNGN